MGYDKRKKNLHWKGWDILVRIKEDGGMDFRELVAFNKAMIAK